MILLSCIPIIEFSSDHLSFGFRENRSANECIAYIFKKLYVSRTINRNQTYINRISKDKFKSKTFLNSIKIKQRTTMLSKQLPANKRKYNYIY